MKKQVLVLLFAFVALLSFASSSNCIEDIINKEGRQWILIEVETSLLSLDKEKEWDQEVCVSFDFRGRYGTYGLVVGLAEDIEKLKQFSFIKPESIRALSSYNQDKPLWVVEVYHKYGLALQQEIRSLIKNDKVIFEFEDKMGKTSFLIEGNIDHLSHLSVTTISVPSSPQIPLKSLSNKNQKLNADPNPLVAELVDKISKDEITTYVEKLSDFFTRLATSPTAVDAQQWLEQTMSTLGLDVSTFPFREGYSSNVIGELKGVEAPKQIVIVSAHYDCRTSTFNPDLRAPGADDNGSGSSNVLEIARVFTESKMKFKHTLRFCLWSGEEQGLYGSRAYAKQMKEKGEDIIAVLNGDMLGWTLPKTNITLGMSDRFISKPLNDLVNSITRTYVPSIGIGPTSACCSDHQSFYEYGYPSVGYAENTGLYTDYPYYHRSSDLPEHLNFEQITLISKSIAAAAATLAIPVKA